MAHVQSIQVSAAAIFVMVCAAATTAKAQDNTTGATVPEVVTVTGSRLTSGFTTPTPVTVLDSEQLSATAPLNIANAIEALPSFKGSSNTTQPTTGSPNSTGAQNLLNLRGLGAQRNLVLLDGQRVIDTNGSGSVDINMLPQSLVKSVDVVTGGASAAYGSDAVSGVVNFILDTNFEGLKGSIQGGDSTYNDGDSYKANLTWGDHFLNGKLHVVASAEVFYENGIDYTDVVNNKGDGRAWLQQPAGLIPNANQGTLPNELILGGVVASNATYGGIITSGPLQGTEFGPGGVPMAHNYGSYLSGVWQIGGDGIIPGEALSPTQRRVNGFSHAEYDVDDTLTLSAEALLGWSLNTLNSYANYQYGQFGFTIFNNNAFLPPSIKAAMTADGITSFPLGRDMQDMPLQQDAPVQQVQRYEMGAKKKFGDGWILDAYYTHSISNQDTYDNNIPNVSRLYAAADAVVNPANGQIVCASTLQGLSPGCVPMNLFGNGSVSQAATNYTVGSSIRWLTLTEDVFDISLSGQLPNEFSLPAGPVSVATGYAYRNDQANQRSDAVSQSTINTTGIRGVPAGLNGRPGGFITFNPLPFTGQDDVNEGFLELGVPLLKDLPFAESLDLNLAGRLSGYSESGLATTWKVGATYHPVDDVLIRVSQSRDIRAPDILELFNPRSTNAANVIVNNVTTAYTGFSVGNAELKPEKSLTTTAGIVFQPSFIPGFSASIDFYNITINDAIAQLGAQSIVNECAAGASLECSLIVQNGSSLLITNPELNLDRLDDKGVDLESAYATEFLGGDLTLRFLANYTARYSTQVLGAAPLNQLDVMDSFTPWAGSLQANWVEGPYSLFLQERYVGNGRLNANLVSGIGINDNSLPAIYYTDVTLQYDFDVYGTGLTSFLTINNLFDQDPPAAPAASTFQEPTNASVYNTIGRYFTLGLRFKL